MNEVSSSASNTGPTSCGHLDGELQRLPLHRDAGSSAVGRAAGRGAAGRASAGQLHHPRQHRLDLHAEPAGEPTAYSGRSARSLIFATTARAVPQRLHPALGGVEVVARRSSSAARTRTAARRRATRSRTAMSPLASRSSHGSMPPGSTATKVWATNRWSSLERPQRRLLPGRVAVEGEHDLAAELVLVHQQPAQHPDVVLAERRAAGRDRRRHPGEVAGHHVGVALDDDGLPRRAISFFARSTP